MYFKNCPKCGKKLPRRANPYGGGHWQCFDCHLRLSEGSENWTEPKAAAKRTRLWNAVRKTAKRTDKTEAHIWSRLANSLGYKLEVRSMSAEALSQALVELNFLETKRLI